MSVCISPSLEKSKWFVSDSAYYTTVQAKYKPTDVSRCTSSQHAPKQACQTFLKSVHNAPTGEPKSLALTRHTVLENFQERDVRNLIAALQGHLPCLPSESLLNPAKKP
jgi:hypothetical protein